jgi:hypothetical protein
MLKMYYKDMKKEILIVVVLTIIIVVLLGVLIFLPAKKNLPVVIEGLQIISPKANEEVSSPIKIIGVTNGWNGFEGQVGTVQLLDYKGNKIAEGILTATTDWTKPPVAFETTLTFQSAVSGPATLLFKNENPSGLPQNDKQFILPIKVKASNETMTVKAYFAKKQTTGSDCSIVFPVNRIVSKTEASARSALEELFKGPTDAEKAQGFFTNINSGVKVQRLVIDSNGTVRADFSEELETTGGSCRVTEIRSEINFTLKQFPTIKNVIISINGRTEDILQP